MAAGSENRGRVLVVEDTDGVRWLIEHLLEREGYEIQAVTNGAEALAYLSSAPSPAVIVLDLSMPVMTGWEFLEWQRRSAQFAEIPVVLYSAEVSIPEERLQGTNVVAFVSKAETPKRLLCAVAEAANLKRAVGEI